MRRFIVVALAFAILHAVCQAQPQTGVYPNGAFDSKIFDTVNIGNLNVYFSLPVYSKPGRGLPFFYNLAYNSSVWTPVTSGGSGTWQPALNWGWTVQTAAETGYMSDTLITFGTCTSGGHHTTYSVYGNFVYHDTFGEAHPFTGMEVSNNLSCSGINQLATQYATDSSGYLLTANDLSGPPTLQITAPTGKTITTPLTLMAGAGISQDPNGNVISVNSSGQFTDTTGNVVLTVSGSAPSPMTYAYTDTTNTTRDVTVNYTSYSVETAFGCSGISDYGPTSQYLISSIGYPDGTSYSFTYEATPGVPGKVTGRLASVTLPEGGTIQYSYSGGSNGIECADGGTATFTKTLSSVTGSPTTTYTRTPGTNSSHTEVIDGLTNYAEYDFVSDPGDPNHTPYLINHKQYQGNTSGSLLLSEQSCLNGATPDCTGQSLTLPITLISRTSTLDGTSVRRSILGFNSYGLLTDDQEDDFGSGSSGGALSDTEISYASLSNGIIDHPSTITTLALSGMVSIPVSKVSYGYDANSLTATSGLPQHNSISGSRGNLTSVQYATGGSGSTPITTAQFYYDDAGQVRTSNDALGNATTYTYDSATDAFLSGTSYPTTGSVTHSTSASWDAVRGVMQYSYDLNGNQTTYGYDSMLRPASISTPAGGYQSYSYSLSSSSPYTSVSTLHTTGGTCPSTSCITATSYLDPYGRLLKTDATDTPSDDLVAYGYDADGNLSSVSNPYRSGTPLNTVTTFDALRRPKITTDTDSSQRTASYFGNSVTLTDEASNPRELYLDGLGRIKEVLEPDGGGNLTLETDYLYSQNATTGTGSTPTTYQTIINQKGGSGSSSLWRTRTFTYDMLGRLTKEHTPEQTPASGAMIVYTYPNGSSSCAGTVTLPCSRTDANGTSTTYSYDALNRITGKVYGGSSIGTGTASVSYYYDQSSYNGLSISNGNGARTGMSDGSGVTARSFDGMGRVAGISKTINSVTKSASYTYNADGTPNTMQDYSGATFTYGYDVSGRPTSIVDGFSNTYASGALYNAAGQLTSLNHQLTSGTAAYARTIGFNNRLQISTIQATLGGSNILNLSYGYGTSGNNNGNILSITNGMDASRSQSYSYDYMNRLASGRDVSHWGETYTYDNWGNLTATNSMSGLSGNNWTVTANGSNQLSNLSFDPAGEVTTDQYSNSFSYDAEGRILTGGSGTYVYDGDGNRVENTVSGTTTLYWPGARSILDQSNGSGTTMGKQVQFAGLLIWHEDSSGSGEFLFHDHLGSIRVTGDVSGTLHDDNDYQSFGTLFNNYGSSPSDNHYLFTGYESDWGENGTDYATYRNLELVLGRFNRPDPYNGSYDLGNPQTLNRYAYALNNPTANIDPSGLSPNYTIEPLSGPDSWACQWDGLDVPCQEAFELMGGTIGGGGVDQCPNNQCTTSINGVLVYFEAYETGSGYVPAGGPGSIYDSLDQALTAGALYAQNESLMNDGNEQCGWTYSSEGGYAYEQSFEGAAASCDPVYNGAWADLRANGITQDGAYHSHGPDMDPLAQQFSWPGAPGIANGGDVAWANYYGLPFSVATGWGNVLIFQPPVPGVPTACQTVIAGSLPGLADPIPICP